MIGLKAFEFYDEVKKYHPDIDEWLTEAVSAEFGTEMADIIQAASVCVTSDAPWEDAVVFQKVCLVLNGRPVISDILQDITVKEIAFAVKCLKKQFTDDAFSDDVCRYIAYEAGEEGIMFMPPELSFVQPFVPVDKLTPDQEMLQKAYLAEIRDYVDVLDSLLGTEVIQ